MNKGFTEWQQKYLVEHTKHENGSIDPSKLIPSRMFFVDYGPGYKSVVTGFEKLRKSACAIVLKHFDKWNLKDGFIMIGNSQGGLIARSILTECDPKVTKVVRRLILVGVPNMGVAKFPFIPQITGLNYLATNFLDDLVYNKFSIDNCAPSSYFKSMSRYTCV